MPAERLPKRRKKSSLEEIRQVQQQDEESLPLPEKHVVFKKWAISRGVEIHPSVTPAALPGRGIGLQTTASIPKGTRVLFVSERAIFKPHKEYAKNPRKGEKDPSPHAHLAVSAFKSFAKDAGLQKWSDTWPTEAELRASLPLFWPETVSNKLPLSTKAILDRQRDDFDEDKKSTDQEGRSDFEYYWAIVNSRSFHWKPPGSKPGFMVLCPFMDYLNHGPNGTGVDVRQTKNGYEAWTERAYKPNEELLLTYGAHSNDKLLVHYGFMHTPTEDSLSDDSIQLDHIILPKLSPRTMSALQDTGYLGNYALIPSEGKFCFKTQVAVRAELLSANEWEYFSLNGEDMGVDRSEDVKKWLAPLLEEFQNEAKKRIAELKLSKGYGVDLATQRWAQIEKALATLER